MKITINCLPVKDINLYMKEVKTKQNSQGFLSHPSNSINLHHTGYLQHNGKPSKTLKMLGASLPADKCIPTLSCTESLQSAGDIYYICKTDQTSLQRLSVCLCIIFPSTHIIITGSASSVYFGLYCVLWLLHYQLKFTALICSTNVALCTSTKQRC